MTTPSLDEDRVRRQSQLLVQRELELTTLRQQYDRARQWWSTFQSLAGGLAADTTPEAVCDRWADTLTDELDFQSAAILRVDGDELAVITWPQHLSDRPPPLHDAEVVAQLRARRCGACNEPEAALAQLARFAGLERFLWCVLAPTEGVQLVVIAGFDGRVARYRAPFNDEDASQFEWISRQLETLLKNVYLVRMLAQQEQLQAMNHALASQHAELESRLATIELQAETIRRLSTPVLEIWHDILVLPIVGAVDPARCDAIRSGLLARLAATRARFVILDVTGVDRLDEPAAAAIVGMTRAAALLGARCVLTGVQAATAQTLVALGVELRELRSFRNLRAGLEACMRWRQ